MVLNSRKFILPQFWRPGLHNQDVDKAVLLRKILGRDPSSPSSSCQCCWPPWLREVSPQSLPPLSHELLPKSGVSSPLLIRTSAILDCSMTSSQLHRQGPIFKGSHIHRFWVDINCGRHRSTQFCRCRHSLALLTDSSTELCHVALPSSVWKHLLSPSHKHTCPQALRFLPAWYVGDCTTVFCFHRAKTACFLMCPLVHFLVSSNLCPLSQWVVILFSPFFTENSARTFPSVLFCCPFLCDVALVVIQEESWLTRFPHPHSLLGCYFCEVFQKLGTSAS